MIRIDTAREELLQHAAAEAVSAMGKGDVLAELSHTAGVSFEFDRLHSIEDVSHSALSCRLFEGDRAGCAFVNEPSRWGHAVKNARESARFGKTALFELPSGKAPAPLAWKFSPKNCAYTKEELKDMGSALLNRIKKDAPQAKVTVDVSAGYQRSFLANTAGFSGDDRCSWLSLMGGLFELAADGSFIELYEGETYYQNIPSLDTLAEPLLQRLEWSRSTAVLKPGRYPVLFAPSAAGILLDPVLSALNGKTVNKGLSVLKGKLGRDIVSSAITLTDDPFLAEGSGYTFDDEGTSAAPLPLIEKGILKNFIFDCAEAEIYGAASTGHAARGTGSLPSPSFSNVCVAPGTFDFSALLKEAGTAVLLCEGLGEGQSNVLAGDFSVLGSSAFLIKNGKISGRIKNMMFSGNVYDALGSLQAAGSRCLQEGGLYCPPLLIEGLAVSSGGGN